MEIKEQDFKDLIEQSNYWQDKYIHLLELIEAKLQNERNRIDNAMPKFYKGKMGNSCTATLEEILKEVIKQE